MIFKRQGMARIQPAS